jgi:hypothetical protein
MGEELEICRETIRSFLLEDLGKRKICARFVPHYLADEQKALRLQACQVFFQSVGDRFLLDPFVTGDDTCYFQYDPKTKIRITK